MVSLDVQTGLKCLPLSPLIPWQCTVSQQTYPFCSAPMQDEGIGCPLLQISLTGPSAWRWQKMIKLAIVEETHCPPIGNVEPSFYPTGGRAT